MDDYQQKINKSLIRAISHLGKIALEQNSQLSDIEQKRLKDEFSGFVNELTSAAALIHHLDQEKPSK